MIEAPFTFETGAASDTGRVRSHNEDSFLALPEAGVWLVADGMGGLAQAASLIGMTGLTLLVVLWASLPVVLAGERRRGAVLAAALLLLPMPALWAWGQARLAAATDETVPGVALRIVQPNVPQEQKWREENARGIFDTLKQLSAMPTEDRPEGIGGVTHLVWPESAVPFLIDESPVARAELQPMLGGRTLNFSVRETISNTVGICRIALPVLGPDVDVAARWRPELALFSEPLETVRIGRHEGHAALLVLEFARDGPGSRPGGHAHGSARSGRPRQADRQGSVVCQVSLHLMKCRRKRCLDP